MEELIEYAEKILEHSNINAHLIITKAKELQQRETKVKNLANVPVSGSLPLAEKLLNSIVAADPNVIHNYNQSDIVIRGLYTQCKELVKSLGGNDR